MADVTKAQKLAAARKKLKEYQSKSHKPTKQDVDNDESANVSETLSSSTHSSVNGNFDVPSEPVCQPNSIQASPFHNYFNTTQELDCQQESSNFFDNLDSNTTNYKPLFDMKDNTTVNQNFIDNLQTFNKYECDKGSTNPFMINEDVIKYPESKQTELDKSLFKMNLLDHPTVSSEDAKILSDYMQTRNKQEAYVEKENESESHQQSVTTYPSVSGCEESGDLFGKTINSNTENLRQLSTQLSELIKEDIDTTATLSNELETRNIELAGFLEQERLKSQTLQVQVNEHQNRLVLLESELQKVKVEYEHKLIRELGPLQEQLQCHAQTVGILVGEKTELFTALSQSQVLAKQKVGECEELQGRLKTSRSRVADLEKELQNVKSAKAKLEQNNFHEEHIESLKNAYEHLKNEKEGISQDVLELKEKYNIKVNENLALQREIQEVSHQLSLARVKIEQITAGESLQSESQVEILTQQKIMLEKQLQDLSHALKATGDERDQASVQYQNYVQQLNGQVASLASKLETLTVENETLVKREQSLIQHIGELEIHLQNIQDERINFASNRGPSNETKKELETALESLENLQLENNKLKENYENILSERDDLLKYIENKQDLIEKLQNELERYQSEHPDSVKLLAAMESDKIAASRAVQQNSELKQQLEEMQQVFVKMSNDKLDLTERLTTEEFHNKELHEKVEQTESQLHMLSDAINIKDKELTEMRETLTHKNKQILQQDQLADRLRHYEAQNGSSHALQHELQALQEQIQLLTKENGKLKLDAIEMNSFIQSQHAKQLGALKLEETNTVAIKTSHTENVEVGSQTITNETQQNIEKCTDLNYIDKEVAMKHLEEKFTRTMTDVANLIDEKQRLEHIVTQLQDETETIGEYIALYQHQRGILRQRTQEKDEQLQRLAEDREKVRNKLDALNVLVKKLVLEKGVLTPEILEQHQLLNQGSHKLCSEHAKMQQEINNVNQNNYSTITKPEPRLTENNNMNTETAEEIISLLAEIKSSNLIQPQDGLENFHPCPWCSGQLITV